jgi:hypothetical protein
MLESYEKPEILTQKMEMNVLRATCKNKATLDKPSDLDDTFICYPEGTGCGSNCDNPNSDFS